MVPEGGSAKLVCKSRGFPKPKITWKREDGRDIIARNGPHGKTKCTSSIFSLEHLFITINWKFITALNVEGEMLSLTKITRSEMGAYLCIASNGVPPSVSKRMKLQVHCKFMNDSLEKWTPFLVMKQNVAAQLKVTIIHPSLRAEIKTALWRAERVGEPLWKKHFTDALQI